MIVGKLIEVSTKLLKANRMPKASYIHLPIEYIDKLASDWNMDREEVIGRITCFLNPPEQ